MTLARRPPEWKYKRGYYHAAHRQADPAECDAAQPKLARGLLVRCRRRCHRTSSSTRLQTSWWIREVRDHGGVTVNWKFFSLEEINRLEGKKHPWEREWSYGWSMMRPGDRRPDDQRRGDG